MFRAAEGAFVRFETPPGKQAQVDWGSRKILLGGKETRIHIFVMVLGYSRAIYVEFTPDEKLDTLIWLYVLPTGGAPYMPVEERLSSVTEPKPELASCNGGTINFALHPLVEKIKEFKHDWEKLYLEWTA